MTENRSKRLSALIVQIIHGMPLSTADAAFLAEWRQADEKNELLYQQLLSHERQLERKEQLIFDQVLTSIKAGVADLPPYAPDMSETAEPRGRLVAFGRLRTIWKVAAVIAFVAVTALLLQLFLNVRRPEQAVPVSKIPSAPGSAQAVLVLADGTELSLDSSSAVFTRQQGRATVNGAAGQLTYQAIGAEESKIEQNTLRVPMGGEYRLSLADGSQVRLNAGTEITFPPAFAGKTREVTLKGEAYFDIATDASRPFIVHIENAPGQKDIAIQVLGTHFNVSAYADDPAVITTLVSGAIKVNSGERTARLQPGDQARITAADPIALVPNSDVAAAIGWTKGVFLFKNEPVGTLLNKVRRWYNLEIHYPHGAPGTLLSGRVNRYATIDDIIKLLASNNIKAELNQHTLSVETVREGK